MSILENISLAFSGLVVNKMRTILTMLGIIIGIASVIAIMTMGNSMSLSVASSLNDMGLNKLYVNVIQNETGGASDFVIPEESDYISEDMIRQFQLANSSFVKDVAFSEELGFNQTVIGENKAGSTVIGVSKSYASAENIKLIWGRFITDRDMEQKKKVAVVSDVFAANLFGDKSPIGMEIMITVNNQDQLFTIGGVYEYTNMWQSRETSKADIVTPLYIPIFCTSSTTDSNAGHLGFTVLTLEGTDQMQCATDTEAFFNQYYENNPDFFVSVYNMKSMIDEANSIMSSVQLAVIAIAAISLLVGGIGVMNIMLVSITERTKEIGTRKALGAKNRAIRAQFIVESIIICLIGGIIGIVLGLFLGSFGANAMGHPTTTSPSAVAIAVGFSMAIGVFFGYYPANKAAKMNPIDALRYE